MAFKFKSQWVNLRISVAIVTLLLICITVLRYSQVEHREKRSILASTEIPVEYIDPASIDLAPLVNTLINATHTGSQHLFSVLSVTSHSSLALHKLTLLVYNISDFQDIEKNGVFPMRYCYCVTNKTNDLTDFTAILLDVMGNSTTYLQELFKSSSILSVSQKNSSDCIYICVMAGKTDRDLSQLWDSVPPLFNHTVIEETHKDLQPLPSGPGETSSPALSTGTLPPAISTATQPIMAAMTSSTSTGVPPVSEHSSTLWQTEQSVVHMTTSPSPVPITTVMSTTESKPATVSASVSMTTSQAVLTTNQVTTLITTRLTAVPTVPTALPTTARGTTVPVPAEPSTTLMSSAVTRQPSRTFVSRTATPSSIPSTAITTPTTLPVTTQQPADTTTTTPATTKAPATEKPGCPWRSELFYRGSQREDVNEALREDLRGSSPTVSAVKLQPCVFELCKFFSQCLCRGYSHRTSLQSYCIDSHFWYERHTVEVCSRVRRVAFSRNLKQKCLARMCVKM
ncbi:HERV-H LTR-associating protein 1 [Astyanax mexicanus]|uniref:HERV-H LTR-associating protein 1 n=1 Tax=Astyanax mexicanus TaxID=7994 RepID=UPI0020CADC42|nr:HERV-H LTR-associating protein 1 [Astyanax mexicanus]